MEAIKEFLKDEAGVSMVEYCFLASLIALICFLMVGMIGTDLNAKFKLVDDALRPGG